MNNLPVETPLLQQPPDSLEELNTLITENLKKWDCFDFDVTPKRLNALKKILKGRDLEWVHMEGEDEPFEHKGIITLVVGIQGADFEDHERRR
jgi:hypothetical protein